MARALPGYDRRFIAGGVQASPQASDAVDATSYVGQALSNVGSAGQQLAGQLRAKEEKLIEDRAAVDVANVLSEGDVYWTKDFTARAQAWKTGDAPIGEKLGQDFDKWQSESAQKLPTEASRNYFLRNTAATKARLLNNAASYEQKATTEKLNADSVVGQQADEDVVFRDPSRLDEVYKRRMETVIARNDLSEGDKIKFGDTYRRKLYLSVERGEMERDPLGWYAKRFGAPAAAGVGGRGAVSASGEAVGPGGPAGFTGAVAKVFKHEGGYSPSDGNSGAPVNFGINQRANPDIDVKNLTKAQAEEIYRTRYWNKINGDNLPAALQGTAMDAAVNQGPALANRWIAESGGDPVKFNALRREHYERLLQEPRNQPYRKAWMGRLESYEREAKSPAPAPAPAAPGAPAPAAPAAAPIEQPKTFTGMDWEQQSAIKSAAETKIRQGQALLQSDMDAKLRDAAAMHVDGKQDAFNLTPRDFDAAYGLQGRAKYEDYQAGREMARDIGQFTTMSPAEIQASLANSKAQVDALATTGGMGYAAADARQSRRMQAAASVVEAQQKDPQAYAARAGLSNAQTIDLQNPQQMGAELAKRASTAAMMRDKYQAPYRMLTNAEATQLAGAMQKFPTAVRVQYLETMRSAVQDPAGYRALMQQIAPDSPVTAVAGSILTKQEWVQPGGWFKSDITVSPKAVATTILQGESILNPTAADKKQDGRGGNFPMPKDTDMEAEFASYVGQSFRGDASGYSAAYQAYRAYYAGRASDTGILSKDLDSKISREALAAVTGGVMDYNGNGQVLKPWGMSDADFKNVVHTQFQSAMQAQGLKGTPMDNLSAYGLQALRENQYLLTNGASYVVGKDGQPIVLNVAQTRHTGIPGPGPGDVPAAQASKPAAAPGFVNDQAARTRENMGAPAVRGN